MSDLKRKMVEELLKEHAAGQQQPDEISANELSQMSETGMTQKQARRMLETRVEDGTWTKRQVKAANGRMAWVYKPVEKLKR